MTKIKLCGLTRMEDIEAVNELMPEYAGFVFAQNSTRYISAEAAGELKARLLPEITAVGVFVNADCEDVAGLLNSGVIDMAQLHGDEDEEYIRKLKGMVMAGRQVIKAFKIKTGEDIRAAKESIADYVLLDSGAGTGRTFEWSLIKDTGRPYFLAGGLAPENVADAIEYLHPFAVDVSSGIETDGVKDRRKMEDFVNKVRALAPWSRQDP